MDIVVFGIYYLYNICLLLSWIFVLELGVVA